MSSYNYEDLMFPALVEYEKKETKPYLMTQVNTSYGGNGLAPVYSSAGNGGGVAAGAAVGGAAVGGNASDVVDDTYAGNGAIPGGGATDGGDVSSTVPPVAENGGDSAPSAIQPVDSYATFASYFEKMRKNSVASAEAARENAYQIAEQATERAAVDAQNSYRKNLSVYGARAEALAGAGLAGSGYADYLDSKAYATMRGEVQAARAQEFAAKQNADYIEGQAKLDADNSYQANMLELEKAKKTDKAQKLSAYQTMLGNAHSGVYATVDAAKDAAATAGMDETQTAAIVNATQKYIDRLQYANNEEVALELGDDIGVIQNKVLGGKLSEEQGQQQIYNILSEQYENAIVNGAEFDASRVAEVLTDKALYDKFVKLYNERYETSDKAFLKTEGGYTVEGEYITVEEAKSILAKALDDPLLSPENKEKMQAAFDARYPSLTSKWQEITANPFGVPDPERENEPLTVNIEKVGEIKGTASGYNSIKLANGERYIVDIDFANPAYKYIQEIARKGRIEDNSVFVYNGSAYYKAKGGVVYELRSANGWNNKDSYADLVKRIRNSNGSTGG